MIVVFWLEEVSEGAIVSRHQTFEATELAAALACAERLRSLRQEGRGISHVCIQSELPEAVGAAGVAEPSRDYSHYKRRIDPTIILGRPRLDVPLMAVAAARDQDES